MNNQLELIHQNSTWMHFIGGYYKSEDLFIHEAGKFGISRRVPAQVVRGMEFGDRLIFLRYVKGKSVYAFAEGQIIGLTLEGEIANQVGERLIQEGKVEFHEGGGMVQRECGSYFILGTFEVKATLLKEIMDIAQEIHAKQAREEGNEPEPLFVMVNARLLQAYEQPVYLSPSPKFTRGFIRSNDSSFVAPTDYSPERNVVAIDGYVKKGRSKKSVE
ncbi:MAG: hypothetical protein L0287_14140 [Anaerolineae bacterium]|nr:hypothetical protein [Anaerolineae bacterium]